MVQAAARVCTLRDKYISYLVSDNRVAVTHIFMFEISADMHCASQQVTAQ